MKKYIFVYFLSFVLPQTELHQQLLNYLDLYKKNGLEISFEYGLNSEHFNKKEKCKIFINKNNFFKFEMGPKILFFNGNDFRTYDKRTNQLFIQNVDSTILESMNLILDMNYISSLDIKQNKSNSYLIDNNQYNIEIIIDSTFYSAIFKNNDIINRLNNVQINEFKDEIDFKSIEKSDMIIIDMRVD